MVKLANRPEAVHVLQRGRPGLWDGARGGFHGPAHAQHPGRYPRAPAVLRQPLQGPPHHRLQQWRPVLSAGCATSNRAGNYVSLLSHVVNALLCIGNPMLNPVVVMMLASKQFKVSIAAFKY